MAQISTTMQMRIRHSRVVKSDPEDILLCVCVRFGEWIEKAKGRQKYSEASG